MYQNIATKVLTGVVRLSYVNLVTPRASQQGGEPKYSVTLLIPKSDQATIADMMQSVDAAYNEGVQKKWGGARPAAKKLLHDGDGLRDNGLPYGDECRGHWVLTASSKMRPQVVGIDNVNCELAPNDIYSGMYARVTVNFFPFDSAGSKGVGCGLGNVLKVSDGEPLGGGASAESDFAAVAGGTASQMQAPANPAYGTPVYGVSVPTYTAPAPTAAPEYMAPATSSAPRINPITGLPM